MKLRSLPLAAAATCHSPSSPPSHNNKTITSKMPRKSLLRPTLAIACFLALFTLYSFLFHTPPSYNPSTLINGNFTSFDDNSDVSKKVKIYMYDLPRRFTYGVIESYAAARGGEAMGNDALLKYKYPGNQHSAEWYLFSDLNRPNEERVDSAVTRVLDPEEADLFYVPFFSSLSLIVNPSDPRL
ncbi:hypothetical protein OROGR_014213 [Orobanche gracilis]